jgi:hypothetical protein
MESHRRMAYKKSVTTLFVLCLVFILAGDAGGKRFYTGKDLVEVMNEWEKSRYNQDHDATKAAHYVGFVMGVHDTFEHLHSSDDQHSTEMICAIVSRYLTRHPERWGRPAYNLVIDALKKAFSL